MTVSCIILETRRDIDQKSWFFHTALAFDAPVRGTLSDYCLAVWCGKTIMMCLPDGGKSLTICLPVLTECTNVTDRHTDRHRITSKAALDESIARQKPSHFFVYTRRATQDLHHTWHGDRGGPSHFCTPPKLYLIRSVVTPLGAIENLWENPKMPPLRENAYNLGVCPLKVTKLKT